MDNHTTPDFDHPELGALDLLEAALTAARLALTSGQMFPDLQQDWIPPWRLPQSGPGWARYWIMSAEEGLREALSAYRHALTLDDQRQLRLLPLPPIDPTAPF